MSDSHDKGSIYIARQNRLRDVLSSSGLDLMVFNPGPSMTYLTGLIFHLMERPVVALFRNPGSAALVLPELESPKLNSLPVNMKGFTYGEDPGDWVEVFSKAAKFVQMDGRKVGVEPTRLRFLELKLLERAASKAEFLPATEGIGMLRARKDLAEIAAIRQAAVIAEQALEATLPFIHIGKSEREIAAELTMNLFRIGSDAELPFTPIVSGGPNSANPHASPGDRKLEKGDLLVIDWGASCSGYISDLTRTFAIGKVDLELEKIASIVAAANAAGRAAVEPETKAESVDQAARRVIEESGYGNYFIHRTGHGIGMEAHEEPYIRSGNKLVLQTGMVFTVEPGIYLPGRGGVRIEDDIVITSNGAECLSSLPRELRVLE